MASVFIDTEAREKQTERPWSSAEIAALSQSFLNGGYIGSEAKKYLAINDKYGSDEAPHQFFELGHIVGVSRHILFHVGNPVPGEETLRCLAISSSGLGVNDNAAL